MCMKIELPSSMNPKEMQQVQGSISRSRGPRAGLARFPETACVKPAKENLFSPKPGELTHRSIFPWRFKYF